MPESRLPAVVVVLYEPQDPVNIAATIRAMKNMGVSRLRLVRPVEYDVIRLEGIAHRTTALIERIERFDSFDDAVADCIATVGFPARRRAPLHGGGGVHGPPAPRQAASHRSEAGRIGTARARSRRTGGPRVRPRG